MTGLMSTREAHGCFVVPEIWRDVEDVFAIIGGLGPHKEISGQRKHLDKDLLHQMKH